MYRILLLHFAMSTHERASERTPSRPPVEEALAARLGCVGLGQSQSMATDGVGEGGESGAGGGEVKSSWLAFGGGRMGRGSWAL